MDRTDELNALDLEVTDQSDELKRIARYLAEDLTPRTIRLTKQGGADADRLAESAQAALVAVSASMVALVLWRGSIAVYRDSLRGDR
jgi:hypothetical protein